MTDQELMTKIEALLDNKTREMAAIQVPREPSPEEMVTDAKRKQLRMLIKIGSILVAALLYVVKGHAWLTGQIDDWETEVRTEAVADHQAKEEAKEFRGVVESNVTTIGELRTQVGDLKAEVEGVKDGQVELRSIVLESAPKAVRKKYATKK